MRLLIFAKPSEGNCPTNRFLNGVATDLLLRGHDVAVYEPASLGNGRIFSSGSERENLADVHPYLERVIFDLKDLDLDESFDLADLILVHADNDPGLISRIGHYRGRHPSLRLLLHDTRLRETVSDELRFYDGILTSCETLRELYIRQPGAPMVWTWHHGADTRIFKPSGKESRDSDVIWIGDGGGANPNLQEFFIGPVRRLDLKASVYGADGYNDVLHTLNQAGNTKHPVPFRISRVISNHRMAVHIPASLVRSHIPSATFFETLACGTPLITTPWDDTERLFSAGSDFLVARNGTDMTEKMADLLTDNSLARDIATQGLETIRERHTCGHRATELLRIADQLGITGESDNFIPEKEFDAPLHPERVLEDHY